MCKRSTGTVWPLLWRGHFSALLHWGQRGRGLDSLFLKTSDNKTWNCERVGDFFKNRNLFLRRGVQTCPWAWFFFFFLVTNILRTEHLPGSPVALPCAPSLPCGMRGPHWEHWGWSSRRSDMQGNKPSCFHSVISSPAASPPPPAGSSCVSRPAPAWRALGTSASGVLSTPTLILTQDDPCTDDWKLDLWKSSICLKKNRCYLLPPDKDNEKKSANNRLGVMVLMLISNCWDTSHGKFLCGFGGVITRGPHQDARLETTLAVTLPAFRKCPQLRSSSGQKHTFRGGFAFLHCAFTRQAPDLHS